MRFWISIPVSEVAFGRSSNCQVAGRLRRSAHQYEAREVTDVSRVGGEMRLPAGRRPQIEVIGDLVPLCEVTRSVPPRRVALLYGSHAPAGERQRVIKAAVADGKERSQERRGETD